MANTAPQYSTKKLSIRADPYALAYRYWEYLEENPKRKGEGWNSYYRNLLANQPDPHIDSTTDRARAIRYAKKNYECFYESRDIKRIVDLLNEISPTSYTNERTSNESNSTGD